VRFTAQVGEMPRHYVESMRSLNMPSDEFRRLAARVASEASRYLDGLDALPIFPNIDGETTNAAFIAPAPQQGLGAAAFDDLSDVAGHSRVGNGRFFGYVMGSGEPVGAIADLYASVLNQNVTAWRSAPAAVTIEHTVIGWLAEAIGCPEFVGSLTGGGSAANLMGLAMAREAIAPANDEGVRPGVVYASSEVHMSINKSVALLGLGRNNLRLVPVDDAYRLRVDALEAAIVDDERSGRRPIAVVACAGTVNTGAIDPLGDVAAVARAHSMWMHVDGAYGTPAALAAPERFAGLAEADSLSLDAHKWLYQPIACSVLLHRHRDIARQAFSDSGDYVRSLSDDPTEGFTFFDESIELTRRARALPLWLSLRYHGLETFRAAIAQNLRQAQHLAQLIDAEPSLERLAPVELSAVCFRWNDGGAGALNERNQVILRNIVRRGRVYLSYATLNGTFALRACIVNHRTTDDDVAAIVEEVLKAAQQL
jgi:aromatic-L-amino-acid decarboxylase